MTRGSPSNPPFLLLSDEKIIFKTNPHWLFIVVPVTAIALFWLVYLFFACPFLGEMNLEDVCYAFAPFVYLLIILILYLDWRFNRLYLTDFRLVKERGIVGKRFMSIWLDSIEDITCSYGILGRIFGFGDLIIESAGTYGRMTFEGMPRPRRIRWRIERHFASF